MMGWNCADCGKEIQDTRHPREVSVHRKEVYDAIQREREANRPPQQYFDAISRSPAAESDGNSLDTTEPKE